MARGRRTHIHSSYDEENNVVDESPSIEETRVPDTKKGIVCNAQFVRVRKEPSGTSTTLRVMEKGEEVTILGKSTETFYKIDLGDDNVGYISCNYCEEVS